MYQGINEILPDQLSKRYGLLDKIEHIFRNTGCKRITSPTFEPYEPLSKGWNEYLQDEAIKFINEDGVTMVLRPEMTSPVARLICSRTEEITLPLKLYYIENVFRKGHILRKNEFMQIGVELVGRSDSEADTEVIYILQEILKAGGLDEAQIVIGYVSRLQNWDKEEQDMLEKGFYNELKKLPEVCKADQQSQAFKELQATLAGDKYLDMKMISFTEAAIAGVSYYSGMYFSVYYPGLGYTLGSGGRYDQLYAKYGKNIPAVGFALEFEKLAMAIGRKK